MRGGRAHLGGVDIDIDRQISTEQPGHIVGLVVDEPERIFVIVDVSELLDPFRRKRLQAGREMPVHHGRVDTGDPIFEQPRGIDDLLIECRRNDRRAVYGRQINVGLRLGQRAIVFLAAAILARLDRRRYSIVVRQSL